MSDVENVDIMLGSYSRCDEENNISENEGNLDSGSSRPQQSSNVIGEDFRSLLNTNSRENSEITIETTRLISEEISSQMSRKLNEVKTNLSSQVQEAITDAITNTVLPAIQNTLETQGRLDFTMVDRGSNGPHLSPRPTDFTIRDRRSSGLQRNAEVGNAQKSWENRPRTCFTQENTRLRSRESSADSNNSEQIHDNFVLYICCKRRLVAMYKKHLSVTAPLVFKYHFKIQVSAKEDHEQGHLEDILSHIGSRILERGSSVGHYSSVTTRQRPLSVMTSAGTYMTRVNEEGYIWDEGLGEHVIRRVIRNRSLTFDGIEGFEEEEEEEEEDSNEANSRSYKTCCTG